MTGNVSPENTRAAVRDLDRDGIRYELLTFDNEGHGEARRPNGWSGRAYELPGSLNFGESPRFVSENASRNPR